MAAVVSIGTFVASLFLLEGEIELSQAQVEMVELLAKDGEEMDENTFEALRHTIMANFESFGPLLLALGQKAMDQAEKRATEESAQELDDAWPGDEPVITPPPGPEPKQLCQDNEFLALLDKVNGIGTKGVLS